MSVKFHHFNVKLVAFAHHVFNILDALVLKFRNMNQPFFARHKLNKDAEARHDFDGPGVIRLAQHVGVAPPIRSFTVAELESLVSSSDFEIVEMQMWDEKMMIHWIVARKIEKAGELGQ